MLMFAVTGVTLNHAGLFEKPGQPVVREVPLPDALSDRLSQLPQGAAVPAPMVAEIRRLTDADLSDRTIDNQSGEMIFDLTTPGLDRILTIDLNAKAIIYEVTDRGTVALFNDLHKGRHAGGAWKFLIDVAAAFFVVFALTGFGLLWLHARTRISTWPLTALGLVVPIVTFLILVH